MGTLVTAVFCLSLFVPPSVGVALPAHPQQDSQQSSKTESAPDSSAANAAVTSSAADGEVVDRIAARVEGDIIALSEVRELAAYQQLLDGQSQPAPKLIDELVEQWAINNEAQSAQFSQPSDADVDLQIKSIQQRFKTPQAFSQRLAALGLTPENLRRIVAKQIYLTRYLDYRFRPAAQVDDAAIEKYYNETLAPALKAKGQPVPSLDSVTDQIREILVEQDINARAAAWLTDTKSRMNVEIEPTTSETP